MREEYIPDGSGSWSHGNQIKACENKIWVKEDTPGWQEGAAEYLATCILEKSNVASYAKYKMGFICRNGQKVHTCESEDFLSGWEPTKVAIVYAIDLLEQHYRKNDVGKNPIGWDGVYNRATKDMSNKQKIQNFVSVIEQETGLTDFGGYFTLLCELDALFRNDDRHLNNIAVLDTPDGYTYCPVFDNGGSFGADYKSMFGTHRGDMDQIRFSDIKPYGLFGKDFEKIVDICRELYGPRLQILNTLDMEGPFAAVEECYGKSTADKMHQVWLRAKGLHREFFVEKLTRQPINEFYLMR